MRLLLDQNLSPRLVPELVDLYPDSTHVREVGLQTADDDRVWRYAAEHGFVVVSKDADFHERSLLGARIERCPRGRSLAEPRLPICGPIRKHG